MVFNAQTFTARSITLSLIRWLGIFLVISCQVWSARADLRATGLELSGSGELSLVTLRFDQEPKVKWFQLAQPYRLVVEFPQTAFAIEERALRSIGLIAGVRYGEAGVNRSRLILSSKQPFLVDKLDVTKADEGYRLSIALKKSTASAMQDAVAGQVAAAGAIEETQPTPDNTQAKDKFTIVLDAGHGGFDGGAEGSNGTVEKDITLAFAQELERKLKSIPGYEVLMTRTDDRFLRLDERVEFARAKAAELFISIHADTIRVKGLRGATVYTGSDRASDAEAQALADRENLSDHIPGAPVAEENPEVSDILHDFVRRETQGFSTTIANKLVRQLSTSVGVINNPHRHARFRVLRAPDVPSVLIELGYLSNAEDEKSLIDPIWRAKAADSIATAVAEFAARQGEQQLSGSSSN